MKDKNYETRGPKSAQSYIFDVYLACRLSLLPAKKLAPATSGAFMFRLHVIHQFSKGSQGRSC